MVSVRMIVLAALSTSLVSNLNMNEFRQAMQPDLVLIQGNKAYRFVAGKLDQVAEIDFTNKLSIIKQHIEYFRVNGMDFEQE